MKLCCVAKGHSESGTRLNEASGKKRGKRRVAAVVMLVPIKHDQIVYRNVPGQTFCNASDPVAAVL